MSRILVCSGVIGIAMLAVSAAARQQALPPVDPARAIGAISGVVLDRVTSQPIRGASVLLSQRGVAAGFAQQRHLTDARGRFVVRNLPAHGSYIVQASKPGFLDGYFGPPDAAYASAQPIPLAEGEWVPGIEVRLTPFGVITGRVTDEAGEPVVGAFVRTLAQVSVAGRRQMASADFTRTDDRGEYRISGLRPGRYFVSVPSVQHSLPIEMPPTGARGGGPPPDPTAVAIDRDTRLVVGGYVTPPPRDSVPRTYPALFFPGARTIDGATAVQLGPGQTQTADFQLQPVPAWRVTGLVDSGGGAAGLVLRLIGPGLEDLGAGSETATAVVDAQGRFSFVNVPAGRYTLEGRRSVMEYRYTSGIIGMSTFPASPASVMQSGGGGTITGALPGTAYQYTTASAGGDLVGRMAIDIAGRDLSGVVLPLGRPVKITGRVERESDDSAAPVSPAQPAAPTQFRGLVQVQPANGSASLGMPTGQIAADGSFEVAGLLAGPYVLRPVAMTGSVRSIAWRGKDMTNTPFDGSAGQDFTDVVITVTTKTTAASGTVRRSSTGTSTVIVFPSEREAWINYGFQPTRLLSVSAASNGSYRAQLPGGEYYAIAVDARHQNEWQDPVFLAKVAPLATRVTLDWGETKTVDLTFVEVP